MHVLATAGHVDHGKSTLVRALTGMEPDRWAEERRRGMTIDLGYAWTDLPGGQTVALVDVPGHERFIANMLAGLGPAPGVLFVVAADGGWSRQSEEHLTAVDALGLRHGVLAVTRTDLADPAPAIAEARARLARSSLGEVAAVAVSAVAGSGLDELRAALAALVTRLPEPERGGRVRLWIDRAFSVRGSGTVVTGTLGAGTVAVGDELLLGRRTVTVRGLQSLGEAHERIQAVARVALNLRGVEASAVHRGDVLLSGRAWPHTDVVDVRMSAPDERGAGLVLHVGTAGVPVHLRPLGADTARLTLPTTLPLLAGDRGVLRDPSRHRVASGVVVLDPDPPRLARRGSARARAAHLAGSAGRDAPLDAAAEIARRGAVRREHLESLGVVVPDAVVEHAGWLVDPATWDGWVAALAAAGRDWAQAHPVDPDMPFAALTRTLGLPDAALLRPLLAAAGVAVREGRAVSPLPRTLGAAEAAVAEVERRLALEPFRAPERDELAGLGLGPRELAAAERAGRLLRVGADLVLLSDAPEVAITRLRTLAQPFSTSEARQALGTTRRVAVPLLEHLDRLGATERVDAQRRRIRD